MTRKVSIAWFRQNSGSYALKGITVREDERSYDSTHTFRDQDARWLTKVLGADADVELSGNISGDRTSTDYPDWAARTGQAPDNDDVLPLEAERAGAALLRDLLTQMLKACDIYKSNGLKQLTEEATAVLLTTEAGTHYNAIEARTILERRGKKAAKSRSPR
jgi:hypothetical protein